MSDYAAIAKEAAVFTEECVTNNRIDPSLFDQYNIKRGLRGPGRQRRAGRHYQHLPH